MSRSTRALARAALLAATVTAPILALTPTLATAQVSVSVSLSAPTPPPELVTYDQPPIPGPGYLWTPGYWAWDDNANDYYWVAGDWVEPPQAGLYWTPGYWAFNNGAYAFNAGYWGPTVGFYGGINYGFGYNGAGYFGGRWQGGVFQYNRSVTHITNVDIKNVYNEPVPRGATETHASFNGGEGGVNARPTEAQAAAAREHHIEATAAQTERMRSAEQNRQAFFKENQGKPPMTAERPNAGTQSGAAEKPAEPTQNAERPAEKNEAAKPAETAPGEKPAQKTEAERPAEKPAAKAETEQRRENPAAKTEAERPAEKPAAKAEMQRPAENQPARAEMQRQERPAMEAPRAAGMGQNAPMRNAAAPPPPHPQAPVHAQGGGPQKGEPEKKTQ